MWVAMVMGSFGESGEKSWSVKVEGSVLTD